MKPPDLILPGSPVRGGSFPMIACPDIVRGRVHAQNVELFAIATDPNESKDIATGHPETVEKLFAKLVAFRKLQPADAIPPYGEGRNGFIVPRDWKIDLD
jgi:hypothetical protein